MIAALELTTLDYVLIVPGLFYLGAFVLISKAEGNAAVGYTLFGSKRAGNILFLVMVSAMVAGAPAFLALLVGIARLVMRAL